MSYSRHNFGCFPFVIGSWQSHCEYAVPRFHFPEITEDDAYKVYGDPEDYNWPEDDFQDWLDTVDRENLPDPSDEVCNLARKAIWLRLNPIVTATPQEI